MKPRSLGPQKYALLFAVTTYEHTHLNQPPKIQYSEADANVMAAVAQYYSDNLHTEVLKGIEERCRQGWQHGLASYGYMNCTGEKEEPIRPHPQNSKAVVRAFELYASGRHTFETLADQLAGEGYAYSLYLQPEEVVVANAVTFSPTRPKFTKLVPVPDAYVGGDTYFGDQARSDVPTVESLIHVPIADIELGILKTEDRRKFKLDDVLTSPAIQSLRNAIVSFVVGGAIQRIIGIQHGKKDKTLKYSFLIHTEAGKDAHSW